jgi:hypothetical protein
MIKSRRWTGHAASTGEKRNAYRIVVGMPQGNTSLGRIRCRWDDNIKINLREVGWGGIDWIHLAEDRDQWSPLVNMIMKLQVP